MRGIIRLNDTTSHGGKVIAAAPNSFVMGLAVARMGDKCVCPLPGHGTCVIAEGDPAVLIDGVPVAFHGHKTTCGAILLSSVATSDRGGTD
jgi:uncharacterized Zn-binding protein involved in type VI secretion